MAIRMDHTYTREIQRGKRRKLLVASLAATLSVASAMPASAAIGEVDWLVIPPSSGFLGAAVTMRSNCMTFQGPTDYVNDYIRHSLLVIGPTAYYVQAGIGVGLRSNVKSGSPTPSTTPKLFWADYRPNGQYWEHWSATTYTYGTSVGAVILKDPANASHWIGSVGGFSVDSTNNFSTPAIDLVAFTDSSLNTSNTYGSDRDLQWVPLGGGWVNGWNASTHATVSASAPATAVWVTPYTWARVSQGPVC